MKVFISYRREDSAGYTGRLYDSLRARFGDENVFLDVSGIASGRKFADVIQGAIQSCDVLLAVIGREWLTCAVNGVRRIDDPGDLVRTEVLTALAANIPVIPVLVGGTAPPRAAALPEPLTPLAALDAHDMSDERWSYDVDRLIHAIETLPNARADTPTRRTQYVRVVSLVLVTLLIGGFFVWRGRASDSGTEGSSTSVATANVAGDWSADVKYDWGANYVERLALKVEGHEVSGTASFLGTPRRIVNGRVDGTTLVFETRSQEVSGDWSQPHDLVHRYRGRVTGDTIAFMMETDGGSAPSGTEFTATRR